MGIIKNGILGGFRKKTGTVVGAFWRRLDVIRALPRNSGKAATSKQLEQQVKFRLVTSLLSNFSNLIDIGFQNGGSTTMTPMNLAVRYHLQHALMETDGVFSVDLAAVKISRGNLTLPLECFIDESEPGKLKFNWTHDEKDDNLINGNDELMVLVYLPEKERFIKVIAAAKRSQLSYEMALPSAFSGDLAEVYVAFASSSKRGLTSNTLHWRNVTLA